MLLFLRSAASQTVTAKKGTVSELLNASKDPDVPNIDADIEDPQLCSHYAAAIYDNLRVAEVCAVNALSLLSLSTSLFVESYKIILSIQLTHFTSQMVVLYRNRNVLSYINCSIQQDLR